MRVLQASLCNDIFAAFAIGMYFGRIVVGESGKLKSVFSARRTIWQATLQRPVESPSSYAADLGALPTALHGRSRVNDNAGAPHPDDPNTALRFSADELYNAGQRLGPVTSPLEPPETTFEEFQRRAKELDTRTQERDCRWRHALRTFAATMLVLSAVTLIGSCLPSRD
jgi:hypothetical protein